MLSILGEPTGDVMSDGQSSASSGSGPNGNGPSFSTLSSGLFMHDSIGLNLGLGFHDDPNKSLPPFSTFGGEGDFEGLTGRLLDIGLPMTSGQAWDFYGEGLTARLTDISNPGAGLIHLGQLHQNGNIQYRPWESKNDPGGGGPTILELGKIDPTSSAGLTHTITSGFHDSFAALNHPKLPSFQSQFPAYIPGQEPALPHNLPVFLQHPPTSLPAQPQPPTSKDSNGPNYEEKHITLLSGTGGAIVTPSKSPTMIVPEQITQPKEEKAFPGPPSQEHFLPRQFPENSRVTSSPVDKTDRRRKPRIELTPLEPPVETAAQVPSISSSEMGMLPGLAENFRPGNMVMSDLDSLPGCDDDRPVKKKRKRCGECPGCMKKDNCGDCAPCKNDKSHQICKMRRCAKLTEKKPKPARESRGRPSMNPMQNPSNMPQGPPMSGMGQFFVQSNGGQNQPVGDPMHGVRPPHGVFLDGRFQQNAWPSPPPANQWEQFPSPLTSMDEQRFQHFPDRQPQQYSFGNQPPGFPYQQQDQFAHFAPRPPSGAPNQPRPSPQPFSPHGMTSPHPSPQAQNQQRSQNYMEISSNGNGQFQSGNNFQSEQSPASNGSGLRQDDDPPYGNSWGQQFHDQSSRRELNNKIKEMILNKQQSQAQSGHSNDQWYKQGQEFMNYDYQQQSNDTVSLNVNIKSEETVMQENSKSDHFLAQGHPQISLKSEGGNAHSDDSAVLPDSTTGSPGQNFRRAKTDLAGEFNSNFNEQKSQFFGKSTSSEISGVRPFDIRYIVANSGDTSTLPSGQYSDLHSMQYRGAFQKPNAWQNGTVPAQEKMKPSAVKAEECPCGPSDQMPSDSCPFYTQLGASDSVQNLRKILEDRFGVHGVRALRFEKVVFTGKEGKTVTGCPVAKWVIRRSSSDEKILCAIRHRPGHRCATAWTVVAIVVWEGFPSYSADSYYSDILQKIDESGVEPTKRQCDMNRERTCLCQGLKCESAGGSFSFGCTWSMFYNGCKYARSKTVRKFKVPNEAVEPQLESMFNNLCDHVAALFSKYSPDGYARQMLHSAQAASCRLGSKPGPFAGVTACMDFCAHAHKDRHDLEDGVTVVATFTKHRGSDKPEDEQLHVLPLYVLERTDEFGSSEGQMKKVSDGALDVFTSYHRDIHLQPPVPSCGLNNRTKAPTKFKLEPGLQEGCISSTTTGKQKRPYKRRKPSFGLSSLPLPPVIAVLKGSTYASTGFKQPCSRASAFLIERKVEPPSELCSFGEMFGFCWDEQLQTFLPSSQPSQYDQTPPETNTVHNNCSGYSPFDHTYSRSGDDDISSYQMSAPLVEFMSPSEASSSAVSEWNSPASELGLSEGAGSSGNDWYSTPQKIENFDFQSPVSAGRPVSSDLYSSESHASLWSPSVVPFKATTDASLAPRTAIVDIPKPKIQVLSTKNEEVFADPSVGGVAIALEHGSVLFECARQELHATTALKNPDRKHPTRLSLVFFHHKSLNLQNHGHDEWERKDKERQIKNRLKKETLSFSFQGPTFLSSEIGLG